MFLKLARIAKCGRYSKFLVRPGELQKTELMLDAIFKLDWHFQTEIIFLVLEVSFTDKDAAFMNKQAMVTNTLTKKKKKPILDSQNKK